MDLAERRRLLNIKGSDEEMKEKCIIDYTVTESAQNVIVNLSDIGNRDDIINSLANANRISVYMFSTHNKEQSANEVSVNASISVNENIDYFRLINTRINKSLDLITVSIADRVSSDLTYFAAITVGNMTHIYNNEFRSLFKLYEAKASSLRIRVDDGLIVPKGTIIKVYVK